MGCPKHPLGKDCIHLYRSASTVSLGIAAKQERQIQVSRALPTRTAYAASGVRGHPFTAHAALNSENAPARRVGGVSCTQTGAIAKCSRELQNR